MVAVAQLVESRIVIPVVVGSNPISHPIFSPALQQLTDALLLKHPGSRRNLRLRRIRQLE